MSSTRYILADPGVNPLEEPIANPRGRGCGIWASLFALAMLGSVIWAVYAFSHPPAPAQHAPAAGAVASSTSIEPIDTSSPTPTSTPSPTATPTATGLLDSVFKNWSTVTAAAALRSPTPVLGPTWTSSPTPAVATVIVTEIVYRNGGGGSTVVQTVLVPQTQIVLVTGTPGPTQPPRIWTATPGPSATPARTQTPWIITATPQPSQAPHTCAPGGFDVNCITVIPPATDKPGPTQTPWVITATPGASRTPASSQTPWVITATAGPSQTPWVITATPTSTETPTATATPTDTPPPTDTAAPDSPATP